MLPEIRARVRQDPRPLFAAVKAAIAANVIDLGAKSHLDEGQVANALREACATSVCGDLASFQRQVDAAI